jgi:hypothetical protein
MEIQHFEYFLNLILLIDRQVGNRKLLLNQHQLIIFEKY